MENQYKTIRCQCGDYTNGNFHNTWECHRGTSITVHHTHGKIYFNHTMDQEGKKPEKFQGQFLLNSSGVDTLIQELLKFKEERLAFENEMKQK